MNSYSPNYEMKKLTIWYSKRYEVYLLCAANELKEICKDIIYEYINCLKISLEGKRKQKEIRKVELKENLSIEQDDNFFNIVGYTSGNTPYGVTWEDAKEWNTQSASGYAGFVTKFEIDDEYISKFDPKIVGGSIFIVFPLISNISLFFLFLI